MTAPASLESLRVLAARKVRAYTVCQIGCRHVVVKHFPPPHEDFEEKVCVNDEDAISYLLAKLPEIPDTPGDLVRS